MVGEVFVPLGSSDFQSLAQTIKEARPDVILNAINGGSNTSFFASLRKAGITPQTIPTISFSIGEEELRHTDPAAMAGDYAASTYFQSVVSAENEAFIAAFRRKFGPQRVLTDPMEAAYVSVRLWAQAVRQAESTEPSDIRRALRNQRLRGPGGDVRVDPATQHTCKTPRIGRVLSNGQFEIVWTAARAEQPNPYPPSRTTEQWKAMLHDLYTNWGNQWSAPVSH